MLSGFERILPGQAYRSYDTLSRILGELFTAFPAAIAITLRASHRRRIPLIDSRLRINEGARWPISSIILDETIPN